MLPWRPQLQGVSLPGPGAMVASDLATEDQVEEVYEDGSSLCTIENDKQEREGLCRDPTEERSQSVWSREGGTAGEHPSGALNGESCPGGGWGLLVLEEGSFFAADLQLQGRDSALTRGEEASRLGKAGRRQMGSAKIKGSNLLLKPGVEPGTFRSSV